MPDGGNGAVNNFLNAFLRGNRDDQPRKRDGSISQALDLMNDQLRDEPRSVPTAPKPGCCRRCSAHAERSGW